MNNGGRRNNYNGYYPNGYVQPRNNQSRNQIPQRVLDRYNQGKFVQQGYTQGRVNQQGYTQGGYNPNGYRYNPNVPNQMGYYPNRNNYNVNAQVRFDPNVPERIEKARKLRNRIIALSLTGTLALTGFVMFLNRNKTNGNVNPENIPGMTDGMNNDDNNGYVLPTQNPGPAFTAMPTEAPTPVPTAVPTPEPTVVPTQAPMNGGDSIIATKNVNMRLSPDQDSFKMGTLYQGTVADRIYTDGTWDLVRVGDTLAYVYSSYTRTNDVDYNNEYYDIEQYEDIVYTTSSLHFRTGPSKNEKSVFMLNKNEQLVVVGKAILRNNPNDVWYVVKARGYIGFVSASYTRSIREDVLRYDPFVGNIQIREMGRVSKDTCIYDDYNNVIGYVEQFQMVSILDKNNQYALVDYNGTVGFIKTKDLKVVKGNLLAVDLSEQRVYYYVNGEVAFYGRCTTGKKSSPTEKGYFTPYGKSSYHDFGHDGYEAKILWMPFNGGQGFHDASWEADKNFGDPNWTAKHGSAGCVRLPNAVAVFVYENVSMKTPVLIKQ